jgi:hypothetical protein
MNTQDSLLSQKSITPLREDSLKNSNSNKNTDLEFDFELCHNWCDCCC